MGSTAEIEQIIISVQGISGELVDTGKVHTNPGEGTAFYTPRIVQMELIIADMKTEILLTIPD